MMAAGNLGPIDLPHLIRSNEFCEIVSEEFKQDGLKRGNYVYVAGQRAFPISESDPYTQRVMFLCHKATKEGRISLDEGFFLIDPKSLMRLPEKKQDKLQEELEKQIEEDKFPHSEVEGEA